MSLALIGERLADGWKTAGRSIRGGALSLLACLIFLVSAHVDVVKKGRHRALNVFRWDIGGYHHYLPATIIYRDLKDMNFLREHRTEALRQHDELEWFGLRRSPATGHVYNKFTYGVALMNLPAFLFAHAWATWIDPGHPADGYSEPYQHAIAISCFMFAFSGLMVMRRFLLRHVEDLHAAIAIIATGLGTNLFFYSTLNAGMSHAYLFFLFALVIERTDAWHRRPTTCGAITIGLALGLILVTRPVDIVIGLVPLLWNMFSREMALEKWNLVRQNRSQIILALLFMIPPLIPQLLYWKMTTGSLIYYSYDEEGFEFAWEKIWNGLFSYRKGWFLYTPIALLGVISLGWMLFKREFRGMSIPSGIMLAVMIMVVFSWHAWWYGGGFGARALVEGLTVLVLPLAGLSKAAMRMGRSVWVMLVVVIGLCIHLNQLQQHQYDIGLLHYEEMNKERYWEIFMERDHEDVRRFPYEE